MKVLYIVPDLDKEGGIQQFAKNEVMSLKSCFDLKVLDWSGPARLLDKIVMGYVPKNINQVYFQRIHRDGINAKIDFSDFDLVNFWHINIAMSLPKAKNSIVNCYGLEILDSQVRHHRRQKFIKSLEDVSAIITCSLFTKNYLIEHYSINGNKIHVIHPGIDLKLFTRKEYGGKARVKPIIGTLTRLVARKNVPTIIKALSILGEKYSLDFTYYLAGDGPERNKILNGLEVAGIDYKYFSKISENDKINKFYPALDVFVLPPLETPKDVEGFGIVFLEANASGVPVVAADTGGVSDAVKPGVSGLFADPTDPEDIAKNIYKILNSKKDYGKSTRKWAENFSQEKTATKFKELYYKVGRQST